MQAPASSFKRHQLSAFGLRLELNFNQKSETLLFIVLYNIRADKDSRHGFLLLPDTGQVHGIMNFIECLDQD